MSTVHMYMYHIILHDVIIWVTDAFLNQPPNKGHLFITDKPSCTNVSVIKRFHCTYHYRVTLNSFGISLIPRPCGRRKHWPGYEASSPYLHTLTLLMQPNGTLSLAARPQLSTLDTWKNNNFLPCFICINTEPIVWGLKPHTHPHTHKQTIVPSEKGLALHSHLLHWMCTFILIHKYYLPLQSTCTHVYMQYMLYMKTHVINMYTCTCRGM